MSTEKVNKRLDQTEQDVLAGMQQEAEHVASVREQAAELRREQRRKTERAKVVERLSEQWQGILEQNQALVQASDGLFGDPLNVDKATHHRDGETRPKKGEAEVIRVHADSRLIPLEVSPTGVEKFGALRLWGVFRGEDPGGEVVSTPRLHFGERARKRDFFDVFDFDSYDIFYVVGVDYKPDGSELKPVGEDLSGRDIYGRRVTGAEGQDQDRVDDILRFTTADSNSQAWVNHVLAELKNPDIPEDTREEYLAWVKSSVNDVASRLGDYTTALDELLLAASRVKR